VPACTLLSAAFMIVVVGTIAAICADAAGGDAPRLPCLVPPAAACAQALVHKIVEWSNLCASRLLGLEPVAGEPDRSCARAAAGRRCSEPDRCGTSSRPGRARVGRLGAAKVFEGMESTADARHHRRAWLTVMQNADPSKLGHGIAAAFAPRYGTASRTWCSADGQQVVHDPRQAHVDDADRGPVAIAQGENRAASSRLHGFLH
jgi:hypothetical protein